MLAVESGGVDGVTEQVTFQFGVVIQAPRLGPGGWVALYQGNSVHLNDSMYVAWGGNSRVTDSAITVGWWTNDLTKEPYRELAASKAHRARSHHDGVGLRKTLAPSQCSGWSPPVTLRWPPTPSSAPGN
ncbi:hypothetical protein ACIBHX_22350 [Nonomuraea sp. NPDC050536]|uniref:hypothetical protein n=1 Tax=Nonomuraea sp. NPDC050536 TaxID=3364366 RepID=UPI0037CB60E0